MRKNPKKCKYYRDEGYCDINGNEDDVTSCIPFALPDIDCIGFKSLDDIPKMRAR